MAQRRYRFLKYIFIILMLWFVAIIIVSLRTDSLSRSQNDIQINVADKTDSPSFVDRIIGALPFKINVDNDHPPEERAKAEEQARKMNAQVQVVAPEIPNERSNLKLNGSGEMGNAVHIDREKLSMEERKKYDDGWTNNAFNQYVSDMISLRRTLADIRDPE